MSEPASFTSSIAARYALAVFEIAQEADRVADLESVDPNLLERTLQTRDVCSPRLARLECRAGLALAHCRLQHTLQSLSLLR